MDFHDLYPDFEAPMTDTGYVDHLATPAQAAELGQILAEYDGSWTSFRDRGDLSLPVRYSNDLTPLAIYGLDTQRTRLLAESYAASNPRNRKRYPFHHLGYTRRPMAVVFRPTGRVISTENYSGFRSDAQRLLEFVEESHPEAAETVKRWSMAKVPERPQDQFKCLIWMSERATDDIVGSVEYREAFKIHPDKPRVWSYLLKHLEIDALEDRYGILTGDCGDQIAVIDPDKVEILAVLENPAWHGIPRPSQDNTPVRTPHLR